MGYSYIKITFIAICMYYGCLFKIEMLNSKLLKHIF